MATQYGGTGIPSALVSPSYLETLQLSPTLLNIGDTTIVSPVNIGDIKVVSPVKFVSSPDSIVPPTLVKVEAMQTPIGTTLIGTPILPSDIYIPSIQLVSDLTTMRLPLAYLADDVCNTENIKEKITKIFYYKLLDKWLYNKDDSKYLLGYFDVDGSHVSFAKSINKLDDYNKNTQSEIDKKVDFIEKNIVTMDDIRAVLEKFVSGTHVSWCELMKNSYFIREAIEKTLENKIKRFINKEK